MLDLSDLPTVDPGTIDCINYTLLHSEACTILNSVGELLITLTPSAQPCFGPGNEVVSILCSTAIGTTAIALDSALIAGLFDVFVPKVSSSRPDKIPFEWRVVFVVEQVLRLTSFGALQCQVLNVFRPDVLPEGPDTVYGSIDFRGNEFGVGLSLQNGNITELGKFLAPPVTQVHSDLENLDLRLRPSIQGPSLFASQLNSLNLGDILMLPKCFADQISLSLGISSGPRWSGSCDAAGNFTTNEEG